MTASGAAGGTDSVGPHVRSQRSTLELIHLTGLNLAGTAGGNGSVAPIAEIGPAFISKLLVVHGILLFRNLCDEVPIGIGASGMSGFVAHITGITGVAVGISRGIIGVEGGIASGTGFLRVVGVGIAPVIVQIAADIVRVDLRFSSSGFGRTDLAALFVIG